MAKQYTFFGNPLREDPDKKAAAPMPAKPNNVTALTTGVDMRELIKKLDRISTNDESARLLQKSGEKLAGTLKASPVTQGLFGARANATTPKTDPTNGNVIPLTASKQP